MATANFTAHEEPNTGEQLCSSELTAGLHGHLTFILVLNSFLSLTAFLGNALILIALHKVSSLHPPSKLLLRCLATTDLSVGLIAEPLAVASWMSIVNENWNICRFSQTVGLIIVHILTGVSMWELTAISVDRLLALLLGLRYKQVVTLKRTYVLVISFWVVRTVFAAMLLWKSSIAYLCSFVSTSLCLLTSVISYTKIFLYLRHHQNQGQDHVHKPNQANQLNIERYKKAVSIAIWLQLTLVTCYLPNGIVMTLVANSGLSSSIYHAWSYALTLVFLNSSLNPILYCWKIEEVRQAVKNTIRQVLCYRFPS